MLYTLTLMGLEVHLTNLGLAVQCQLVWARQEEVSTGKHKLALPCPRAAGHSLTRWPLGKAGERSHSVVALLALFNSLSG